MTKLALCLVLQEVGGGAIDPGFGNIGGIGGVDPGYGRPGGGLHPGNRPPGSGGGAHPDNSLPWSPNSPDNTLPVPPGITAPPTVPPNLKEKLVVLWRLPNTTEWHGKAFEKGHPDAGLPPTGEAPDQGLPPTGQPK